MDFKAKLREALDNFELQSALKLSDSIHDFECVGGDLTPAEDRLWGRLTDKIEGALACLSD